MIIILYFFSFFLLFCFFFKDFFVITYCIMIILSLCWCVLIYSFGFDLLKTLLLIFIIISFFFGHTFAIFFFLCFLIRFLFLFRFLAVSIMLYVLIFFYFFIIRVFCIVIFLLVSYLFFNNFFSFYFFHACFCFGVFFIYFYFYFKIGFSYKPSFKIDCSDNFFRYGKNKEDLFKDTLFILDYKNYTVTPKGVLGDKRFFVFDEYRFLNFNHVYGRVSTSKINDNLIVVCFIRNKFTRLYYVCEMVNVKGYKYKAYVFKQPIIASELNILSFYIFNYICKYYVCLSRVGFEFSKEKAINIAYNEHIGLVPTGPIPYFESVINDIEDSKRLEGFKGLTYRNWIGVYDFLISKSGLLVSLRHSYDLYVKNREMFEYVILDRCYRNVGTKGFKSFLIETIQLPGMESCLEIPTVQKVRRDLFLGYSNRSSSR